MMAKHQVSEMQNRLTNDLQMVNENYVGAILICYMVVSQGLFQLSYI